MTTVALVLGINILVWVPMLVWIRHRARAGAATLDQELEGEPTRMAATVNFFGRLSAGRGQVRGNGNLALTAEELVFVQWLPRRTLRIPRRDITAVETPRSFLGKSQGVELLCVHWSGEDGNDQAAWRVRELDKWVAAIGVHPRA
jgi:hypothetical protein